MKRTMEILCTATLLSRCLLIAQPNPLPPTQGMVEINDQSMASSVADHERHTEGTAAASYTIERWRMLEVTFTSSRSYVDPVMDVELVATFVNGSTTLTRPAFWDGGNTWKVRFAPPETGTWYYTTNCSDASNDGLQGRSGTILATDYSGSLAVYKHGFLKVSGDRHYFTHADGTPFFYLGDTHWGVQHERWNICNYPGCSSQFRFEADKRATQGFTVYQTEWIGGPTDNSAANQEAFITGLSDCDIKGEDLPGFQNADRKIGYLADKGLVVALAVDWRYWAPYCSDAYLRRYGQYWAARYGAYPVLWTTAQEVDGLISGDPHNLDSKWQVVGQALRDYDGYSHPLTAHMCGTSSASNSAWKDLYFHDWFAQQVQGDNLSHSPASAFYSSGKPVVWYEPPYENFWTDQSGERQRAYTAYLSGWYGFGYGVAGIWDDNYQCSPVRDSGTAYDANCREWYDGLFRESGDDMKRAGDFFRSLDWWKLTPRFTDGTWVSFTLPDESRLASDGSDLYVAYFYGKGTGTGTLRKMNSGSIYVATWYNPRTGIYTQVGTLVPAGGEWNMPDRPDENDWVLLARRNPAISINNGSDYTNNRAVQLALFPLGIEDALQMQFSNDDSAWTTPEPFANQRNWSLAEGDGTKTVYVRFNIGGTWSSAYHSTIMLDTVAPTVSILSPAAGSTNGNNPVLNYSASDGSVAVRIDRIIVNVPSGRHFGPLANSSHTISVEAADAAGNVGAASHEFTVNAVPPTVTITSPVPGITRNNRPPLIYGASCCAAVVKLDGAVIHKTTGDNLGPLANGIHTLSVEATDSTGSLATVSVDFTVEYTQLEIVTTSWLSGLLNSGFSQRLEAIGGVTGSGYGWSITDGHLPPGLILDKDSGVVTGTPTAAGSYLITMQVADDGGDSTFKQFNIVIYVQEPGKLNLALNRTYNSSSSWDPNHTAAGAFDGTLDTNWQAGSGNGTGQGFNNSWLEVDFGTDFTFNKIHLSEDGGRTLAYRIEYWNGQTWQTAYNGATLANRPDFKVISFLPVTGSKVRAVFISGTGLPPAIYEFAAYFDRQILDGLISKWHLDKSPEDAVSGNDGTMNGHALFGPGKMNQAIRLDGNGSYLEVPDDNSLDRDLSAMTLSAWVKINSLPTQNYVPIGKEGSYRFVIGPGGEVGIVVATKHNGWYSTGTAADCKTTMSVGQWFHLAATYDGRSVNCYMNGTRESAQTNIISGNIAEGPEVLCFGCKSADNISWMDGMIDEVRLYNRALGDDEVKNLYSSLGTESSEISLLPGGSAANTTIGGEGSTQSGYATLDMNSGDVPYGTAVFRFRHNNVVISEAGVPASPPTRSARIFIDFREGVTFPVGPATAGSIDINTGIALVKPGTETAVVSFVLRDLLGRTISGGSGSLIPGAHHAIFINQLSLLSPGFQFPGNFSANTRFGTLEVAGALPISVVALRMTTNQRGDALLTTTPVADLTRRSTSDPIYFAQFVDGGGYTTSLILLNTTGASETGSFQILDDEGAPLVVRNVDGEEDFTFRYSIAPGGAFRFQTDGSPENVKVGWVLLTPDAGSLTPVGSGVFGYSENGILVTESGIPAATPTRHARVYVDLSEGHNTGLAVGNPGSALADITLRAFQPDGKAVAGASQRLWQVAGGGHSARFVDELISGLPTEFKGVLDVSSASPFVALTLRSLTNERNDFLLTTFPIADAAQPPPSPIFFPQIADGGGYITEFIFLSVGGSTGAILHYLDSFGMPLPVGK